MGTLKILITFFTPEARLRLAGFSGKRNRQSRPTHHKEHDMSKNTYINLDKRYGNSEFASIEDYRELNPNGAFREEKDGVYKLINSEWIKIADAKTVEYSRVMICTSCGKRVLPGHNFANDVCDSCRK